MAKSKQQQRPKRKKLKQGQHDKSKMKEILQKLAQSKLKNQQLTPKLTSITEIHVKNKQIAKKAKKMNKYSQQNEEQEIKQTEKVEEQKPIVNIFAVQSYQAEKPVLITNSIVEKQSKMEHEEDLESKARKVMGENFNLQKFGDKPLKIIQEKNQPIVMSEDEDQPNCLKTITHENLKVPQGSKMIKRKKQIEQLREKLPIFMKQQQIVQTVNTHLVTLICGQTGSGKSTQLPQFLAEKNYDELGKIAITQPRRLATISLARRVAQEMNYKIGSQVAYQVRHERKQSQQSYIKFMTDGILLKEMSSDPLLLDYSVIIIDQAHERKLNTDILIGLLSRLILVRYKMSQQNKCNPLRLVIMSATLRVSDFQNEKLFNFHVPILKVQAKMFPVTIFHQKNTPQNYIDCAVKKCVKIQKQLPQGDVLIFLTGKQQIHEMCIKLQMALKRLRIEDRQAMEDESMQHEEDNEVKVEGQYIVQERSVRKNSNSAEKISHHITEYIIYKLYSSLPTQEQDKIFKPTQPGCRKFIISTNIAQTSITVPNIRYIIDSGQEKHRYFDGVWRWRKGWGSKAMAAQRSGRAGRTTHGYCYRLYSSALYSNIMQEHPDPQICKLPLQSVVLEVKAIGFNNIFTFPFPTPPSNYSLKQALENLIQVKAIEGQISMKTILQKIQPQKSSTMKDQNENNLKTIVQIKQNCKITELGKVISFIPLAPKLAKMLLLGRQLNLQKYVVIIAVLLTIENIFKVKYSKMSFLDEQYDQSNKKAKAMQIKKSQLNEFKQKYHKFIDKQSGSDLFVAMNIAGQFLEQIYKHHRSNKNQKQGRDEFYSNIESVQQIISTWSSKLDLNSNVMREFYYNCDQICEIYETLTSNKIDLSSYSKPNPSQYQTFLEILLSTYSSNVCRLEENNIYLSKFQEKVYIHRMSLLYKDKGMFVGCIQFIANEANGRKYMRYPFKIANYELLSTFGKVKEPHQYVWKGDCVVGMASGQINGWEIPNLVVKDMKGEGKYFAFARMLLNGTVVSGFKCLTQKNWLNYSASNIRPDNLQEKVQKLVLVFRTNDITSKQKLIQMTKNNPNFLQKELKLWLNVKNYDKFYQTLRQMILQSENT